MKSPTAPLFGSGYAGLGYYQLEFLEGSEGVKGVSLTKRWNDVYSHHVSHNPLLNVAIRSEWALTGTGQTGEMVIINIIGNLVPMKMGSYEIRTTVDFMRMMTRELHLHKEKLHKGIREKLANAIVNDGGVLGEWRATAQSLQYLAGLSHWAKTGDVKAATWIAKNHDMLFASREALVRAITENILDPKKAPESSETRGAELYARTSPKESPERGQTVASNITPPIYAMIRLGEVLEERFQGLDVEINTNLPPRLPLIDLVLAQIDSYRALAQARVQEQGRRR